MFESGVARIRGRASIKSLVESAIRRSLREPIKLSIRAFPRSEHDAVRFFMYQHLSELLADVGGGGTALSISGSNYLASLLKPVGIVEAKYPEHDLLHLDFEDNKFDYVVSDQVLEHIEGNPFRAVEESYRVLKPGGFAIHTTVLLVQIHRFPKDFWRFTPDGLRLLCSKFTTVIEADGWGNRYLWALSWLGLLFSERVPNPAWHPYRKIATFAEPDYPIVTWVVAQK